MKTALLRIIRVALIYALLGAAASAQNAPAVITDEIIVRGRTAEALRFEIERAEDAVFARFNEINSHDRFDIHCKSQVPTGRHIPARVCAPNYLRDAEANHAKAILTGIGDPQAAIGDGNYRHLELEQEMQRLVLEDEKLLRAMERLVQLRDFRSGHRGRARAEPQERRAQARAEP
jgi:hypothetical protein